MPNSIVKIQNLSIGSSQPLAIIAGPCVIQNRDITMEIAEKLVSVAQNLNLALIFKASFDKANRTSLESYRGIGIDDGLQVLDEILSLIHI